MSLNFGKRLAAARRAAGLTQKEAAERAGMMQPAWARLESGRQSPTLATAERMAAAVGARLADLVADDDPPPIAKRSKTA